jgi:hypothetical protein
VEIETLRAQIGQWDATAANTQYPLTARDICYWEAKDGRRRLALLEREQAAAWLRLALLEQEAAQ